MLDGCLRSPSFSFAGEYYAADEARTYPGGVQQPRAPFVVAGAGPRAMAVAAQYAQTWVITGPRSGATGIGPRPGAKLVREMMEQLDAACAAIGRDPRSLERMVLTGPELDGGLTSRSAHEDTVGSYEAVGVTDLVVHWPRDDGPFAGDVATFESIFAS